MRRVLYEVEMYKPRYEELAVQRGKQLSLGDGITAEFKEIGESKDNVFRVVRIEVAARDHVAMSDLAEVVTNRFGCELPHTSLRMIRVVGGD